MTGGGLAAPRGSATSRVGPELRCETSRTDASPLKGRKPAAVALGSLLGSEVCTNAAGRSLENPRGTVAGVLQDLGTVRNFSPEHWMKALKEKIGADPIGVAVNTLPVSLESRLGPACGHLVRHLSETEGKVADPGHWERRTLVLLRQESYGGSCMEELWPWPSFPGGGALTTVLSAQGRIVGCLCSGHLRS